MSGGGAGERGLERGAAGGKELNREQIPPRLAASVK